MKYPLFAFLSIACCACNVYNSDFDCPPGKGIGCASVSQVLDLIVERDMGEDLFVPDLGTALILRKEILSPSKELVLIKRESGKFALAEKEESHGPIQSTGTKNR